VPLPLSVLFPKSILDVYNQIFRFLLLLRQAKDRLRSLDGEGLKNRKRHCMNDLYRKRWGLRLKLSTFVGAFYEYLITTV